MTVLNNKAVSRALALAVVVVLAMALAPVLAHGETLEYNYKGEGVSDLTTKLTVTKVDQNRLYVVGAELAIFDKDTGVELVRWTTKEGDQFFDRYLNSGVPLNVGTHYVLKELTVPEGYEPVVDTEFYVDDYGNAVIVSGKDASLGSREQIVLTDVRLLAYETEYVDRVRSTDGSGGGDGGSGLADKLAQTSDSVRITLAVALAAVAAGALAAATALARKRMAAKRP